LYHSQCRQYLNRNGVVDQEWAEKTWEQWTQREFHPAVEAFEAYNYPPRPEMIGLEKLKESLRRGDDAVQEIRAKIATAVEVLEVAAMAPKSRVSDGMPAAMREIFDDLRRHLRSVEKAQQQSKQHLESLEPAVKSLVSPHPTLPHKTHTNPTSNSQLRCKSNSENSTKKRQAEDEKMIDTVKFLKECLDNHSRLVDIVLGRPEPLVKQGTELMQAMLSEMFGLPGPVVETSVEDLTQDTMGEAEEERMEEPEEEPEEDLELASESEAEFLWERFHPQEFIDIEAELASEQESTSDLESELTEFTELSDEEAVPRFPKLPAWVYTGTVHDEYDDDDGFNEQSESSSVTATKSRRTSRQERHERRQGEEKHEITKQNKRERTREEKKALYTRFGLTVEEAEENQNDTHEEERRSTKRQKRDVNTLEVSPESQLQQKPPALKQTTLTFSKVGKSRRLFSRKQLSQNDTPENKMEEAEVVSPGSARRNLKRYSFIRPDYRDYFPAWD
jgi:hypothetical protein